ncbi:unnamed protein product [Tenebrio molitor]|nr:unnamed protein product [Tenebrio molitor]
MMLNEGRGGMEVFGLGRNSSRSNDRGVIATFKAKKCDTLEIKIEKREAKIQIKCIDK